MTAQELIRAINEDLAASETRYPSADLLIACRDLLSRQQDAVSDILDMIDACEDSDAFYNGTAHGLRRALDILMAPPPAAD